MLKSPCYKCPDRTDHCHNETCPHGWMEYVEKRNQHYEERQAIVRAKQDTAGMERGVRKKLRRKK